MDVRRSRRASGTERRQRTELVALRLLPDEHQRLTRIAESRGMTVTMLLRAQISELIGLEQHAAAEGDQ